MGLPIEEKITVTTVGSDGSATGDSTSEILLNGYLLGFRVDYHASAPATTDTTITSVLPSGYPADTLLTLTDVNTDIPYRPVLRADYIPANTASGTFSKMPLTNHKINVAVAGANALTDCVTVWVVYTKDL